jgi:hypothetical protein
MWENLDKLGVCVLLVESDDLCSGKDNLTVRAVFFSAVSNSTKRDSV